MRIGNALWIQKFKLQRVKNLIFHIAAQWGDLVAR